MNVRIFPRANRSIIEIWKYTARTWSPEQADRYVRGLKEAIENASHQKSAWQPIDFPIAPNRFGRNVFVHRYQRHLIFFVPLTDNLIGVITILHDAMNLVRRLRQDLNAAQDED